jgi:hypothetical protein
MREVVSSRDVRARPALGHRPPRIAVSGDVHAAARSGGVSPAAMIDSQLTRLVVTT